MNIAWHIRLGFQIEAIRLRRFSVVVRELPFQCAAAARRRVERTWCRNVCSRFNVDAVRSVVLEFL